MPQISTKFTEFILNSDDLNIYGKINYLHYYDNNNNSITNKIDYSKGYVRRTPDHDNRVKNPYRAMSIVVDCYK